MYTILHTKTYTIQYTKKEPWSSNPKDLYVILTQFLLRGNIGATFCRECAA